MISKAPLLTMTNPAKQKYLPRDTRVKNVSFALTERDIAILKAVNRCRYLRTGQIKRLVFPENRSIQSTRRRLKYLYHSGYLGRVMPFVQIGSGGEETAYFLDQPGQELLHDLGESVLSYQKSGQVRRTFLHHALDLSEFRVCLELALGTQDRVELHRFTADFELKTHMDRTAGKHRYKLYQEITHPTTRRSYVVYPDALIILKGVGKYERFGVLYFLEIDRATESLGVIRDKFRGYLLYLRHGMFKKYGEFTSFKVLLQTTSQKRIDNIAADLHEYPNSDMVLLAHHEHVNEDSVLFDAIWRKTSGEMTALLRRAESAS